MVILKQPLAVGVSSLAGSGAGGRAAAARAAFTSDIIYAGDSGPRTLTVTPHIGHVDRSRGQPVTIRMRPGRICFECRRGSGRAAADRTRDRRGPSVTFTVVAAVTVTVTVRVRRLGVRQVRVGPG